MDKDTDKRESAEDKAARERKEQEGKDKPDDKDTDKDKAKGDDKDKDTDKEKTPPEPKTFEEALAEMKRQGALLSEAQRELKRINHESATRRKELERIAKEDEEKQRATMTETQRLETDLKKERSRREALEKQVQDQAILFEITRVAATLNIRDIDAAHKLADLSKVEYENDGEKIKVTGVENALRALIAEKDWLVRPNDDKEDDKEDKADKSKRNIDTKVKAKKEGQTRADEISRRFNTRSN